MTTYRANGLTMVPVEGGRGERERERCNERERERERERECSLC